jgi:hypothetical protein
MRVRMVVLITGVSIAAAVNGCAGSPGSASGIGAPASSLEAPTSLLPIGEVPADLLDAISSDAAERAGVEQDDVTILTAESVTWSDGSLGCPEPGMMYTQALVPGYRVVVEAGGKEMSFHASERGDFQFCENPKPPRERNPNE